MSSYDEASNIGLARAYGLAGITYHVFDAQFGHIRVQMSSYDVASDVCQALFRGVY